ncbi:MAG: hypothetical protein AUJ55_11695 [Proteobacteria bacterium CG1_02_64_396]|nr:MAG: hypothetical protein AUJ55_11695 [Proteobacteria bacterium CG1_02_64_396]
MAAPHNTHRQQMWDAILAYASTGGCFTAADIARPGHYGNRAVETYLAALRQGGYLTAVEEPVTTGHCHPRLRYRYLRGGGTAPLAVNSEAPTWQDSLWAAIRPLGEFSLRDAVVAGSTSRHSLSDEQARKYLSALASAGFLKRLKAGRWRVVPGRCVGPAPTVRRVTRVIQGGKVVHTSGDSHE